MMNQVLVSLLLLFTQLLPFPPLPQRTGPADLTQIALDWVVALIVVLGALAMPRIPKESRLVFISFWLILLRGMFERGFDAYGFQSIEDFFKGPITRVPVYLFVITALVLTIWDFSPHTEKIKNKKEALLNSFSQKLNNLINRLRPEIETLAINGLLAVGDALILLVGSGQDVTAAVAFHASGAALGNYLTSYYRAKRAKIAVEVAQSLLVPVAVEEVK